MASTDLNDLLAVEYFFIAHNSQINAIVAFKHGILFFCISTSIIKSNCIKRRVQYYYFCPLFFCNFLKFCHKHFTYTLFYMAR